MAVVLLGILLAAQPSNAEDPPVYSTWDGMLEVDRAAAAWLIQKWVAPDAVFQFLPQGTLKMPGTAFDVPVSEDNRRGNRAVAQYWADKHNLDDPALARLLRVVHDIEINLWQEKVTPEAEGLEAIFNGLNKLYPDRNECLKQCMVVLDALYESFK